MSSGSGGRVPGGNGAVRPLTFPSLDPGPVPPPAGPPVPPRTPAGPGLRDLDVLRQRVQTEAVEAGRRQGYEAARAEWDARLGALAEALAGAARALEAQRVELAAEVERRLLRLLFLLARKVLQSELASTDTAARTVIRAVSARLAGAEAVALRVNPALLDTLEAWRRDGPEPAGALAGVRFEADPTLAPGDWVLETRDGFLDGRVESQLEVAWARLTELLGC